MDPQIWNEIILSSKIRYQTVQWVSKDSLDMVGRKRLDNKVQLMRDKQRTINLFRRYLPCNCLRNIFSHISSTICWYTYKFWFLPVNYESSENRASVLEYKFTIVARRSEFSKHDSCNFWRHYNIWHAYLSTSFKILLLHQTR